ncbi:MAG: hypothetical protein JO353_07135 [Phycisphaerae bacterium]|nr:hypothetical protein [Phycisphaerae bacterium]
MKEVPDEEARKIIANCALSIIGDVWKPEADVKTLILRMRHSARLANAVLHPKKKFKKKAVR